LDWCKDLPDDASIIDVGCGDGFHLRLLQEYGKKSWRLEGVDISRQAVEAAEKSDLKIHLGSVEEIGLPKDTYDLAFMIQTIEHVEKPDAVLSAVREILPGSIGKTLYLKAVSRVLGRAVACGYSREMPEKASVWHVYPKNGVSTLCEKLAAGIEDKIKLESPVEEILVENEKVVVVKAKGETHEISAVISTAPAHILAKLVKGTDALQSVAKFRYRPMIFVNMRFNGRGLLPDTVLWLPENEFISFV
jgi:ubiquinone/menaquinone biosynthesis C-methylase UbiE